MTKYTFLVRLTDGITFLDVAVEVWDSEETTASSVEDKARAEALEYAKLAQIFPNSTFGFWAEEHVRKILIIRPPCHMCN